MAFRYQMLYHCNIRFHEAILDRVFFTIYVRSFTSLLDVHDSHVDNTQFYIKIKNVGDIKERVVALVSDIGKWMRNNTWKLNDN